MSRARLGLKFNAKSGPQYRYRWCRFIKSLDWIGLVYWGDAQREVAVIIHRLTYDHFRPSRIPYFNGDLNAVCSIAGSWRHWTRDLVVIGLVFIPVNTGCQFTTLSQAAAFKHVEETSIVKLMMPMLLLILVIRRDQAWLHTASNRASSLEGRCIHFCPFSWACEENSPDVCFCCIHFM